MKSFGSCDTSTEIYINMEKLLFGEDSKEYIVKVVDNIEDLEKCLKVGFEFVTDFEGKKV